MRIIPQLDRNPKLVDLAQTPTGKFGLLLAFAVLLRLNAEELYLQLAALLALPSFFPRRRMALLSVGTGCWLLVHPLWKHAGVIGWVAASEGIKPGLGLVLGSAWALGMAFGGMGVLLRFIRKRPRNFVARRPVLWMVCAFLSLLAAAGTLPLHGLARVAIWTLLTVASPYLWYFAYALGNAASKSPEPYRFQFGTFFPFWTGSGNWAVPIGKGASYLRKVEAGPAQDLAIVQLKAVKLLLWVLLLRLIYVAFHLLAFADMSGPAMALGRTYGLNLHNFGVISLDNALNLSEAGHPPGLAMRWAAVIAHFFDAILAVSIIGNVVVACIRMAGFNVLRNSYKPLYSTTVAEFWNRLYYYFKELLVEFFFFPTYIRYFKKYPRLRLAAATFAAATVGNILFHFCRDIHLVFEFGFARAVTGFQVYAFYAIVLGAAITVSQLRGKRVTEPRPLFRRVLASIGVSGFYCLLEIFDYEGRSHSLATHLAFFASLFQVAP
jgi:hypothetical protein